MRSPDQSSSTAPWEASQDTYLVLEDFGGRRGRAWRETDEEATDHETLIRNLIDDQYRSPVRIVAFNTAEGWSRNVTLSCAPLRTTTCPARCGTSSTRICIGRFINPQARRAKPVDKSGVGSARLNRAQVANAF